MAEEFRSGNGAAWLDLMASLLGRYRTRQTEQLSDPAALDRWLAEFAQAPSAAATQTDLEAARTFREALHRVTRAVVESTAPASADLTVVNAALAHDRARRLVEVDSRLTQQPPATVQEALGALARQAVDVITGPRSAHLHFCGDDTCSGIFIDRTDRRRWCSDERCGNRMRVRAHRAARKRLDAAHQTG